MKQAKSQGEARQLEPGHRRYLYRYKRSSLLCWDQLFNTGLTPAKGVKKKKTTTFPHTSEDAHLSKHEQLRRCRGQSGGDAGGGREALGSFPRWCERKMKVLQSRAINNRVGCECRGEQWHCVEKRWRPNPPPTPAFFPLWRLYLLITLMSSFVLSPQSNGGMFKCLWP